MFLFCCLTFPFHLLFPPIRPQVNRRPINPVPPPLILSSDNFSDADFAAISADPFGNLDHPSTNNSGNPAFTSDESLQPRTARLRHLEILEEVFKN